MRRLLIADVHANLPAFEAVLQDAGAVDEVVFAGDIVDYGTYPAQCVDLLQSLGARAVVGNHDQQVLGVVPQPDAPGEPVNWLQWTYRQLSDAQRAFIASLPVELTIPATSGELRVMHRPPGAPYLRPEMPDLVLARHCRATCGPLVLFGHSHRAIDRIVYGRRIVCLPAVGQPRDGDPRAGYALDTDGELTFHRVEYDVERAVADVRAIGLDPDFTARWVNFLRTAYDSLWSTM